MRLLFALSVVASLLAISLSSAQGKEPRAKRTSQGYALGYVADPGWPKGMLAFEASPWAKTKVLEIGDVSAYMTPDDNQGPVGECTGHGLARTASASIRKATGQWVLLSPKFIYWFERQHLGTINEDSGARIGMDGIATMKITGASLLNSWPMTADWRQQPNAAAQTEGKKHLLIKAYKIDNRNGQDLERAISAGFAVVYGIRLHDSFQYLSARNYVYTISGPVIGGHCMTFYKYNLSKQTVDGLKPNMIRSRNQWGSNWGNKDTFDMSLNIAHGSEVDDCYVLYTMTQ